MPSTSPEESKAEIKARLEEFLNNLNSNPSKSTTNPSTWKERFDPNHVSKDYNGSSQLINRSASLLDGEDILNILSSNKDLSILTIASGYKQESMIIHNIFQSGDNFYGLVGSSDQGNLTVLSPSRLFNNNSRVEEGVTLAPSVTDISNHLHSLKEGQTIQSLDEITNKSEQIVVKNSLIMTPPQTQLVLSQGEISTTELGNRVLQTILNKDKEEMDIWSAERKKVNESGEDEETETEPSLADDSFSHPSLKENISLLQILNEWKAAGKKEAGARVSQNSEASQIQKQLNNSLLTVNNSPTGPPPNFGSHVRFTGGTPETTTQGAHTHPMFEQNNCVADSLSRTQNDCSRPHTTNNEIMANALVLLSQSIDSLQNSNATSRDKKCPQITKQMILNLSTHDGLTPAPNLEQFAEDITKAKISEADLLVEAQLHSEGVVAMVSPNLSKALNTGQLVSIDLTKGFTSLGVFPISQRSMEEHDAILYLREERELGHQLSEQERSKLNTIILSPAKTIQCLQLKFESMSALTKGYCGANSLAHLFFEDLTDWIKGNKAMLELRQKTHDPLLATRAESHFTDIFNQFLNDAKHKVPDERILDTSLTKWGLTNGTVKPDINPAILDALNGNNKKKRKRGESTGGQSSNKKGKDSLTIVRNENQVKDIKVDKDTFRNIIHPQNSDGPLHNNTPECLKFHMLGYCNKGCERGDTHNKLSSKRIEALKNFKKSAEGKHEKDKPKE